MDLRNNRSASGDALPKWKESITKHKLSLWIPTLQERMSLLVLCGESAVWSSTVICGILPC